MYVSGGGGGSYRSNCIVCRSLFIDLILVLNNGADDDDRGLLSDVRADKCAPGYRCSSKRLLGGSSAQYIFRNNVVSVGESTETPVGICI